jgi:hypothetical protein
MQRMKRRTLLQWLGAMAGAVATVPLRSIRLLAQPRDLPPESVATLYEIAASVLPASLGAARVREIADKFVAWTRGYREGVALSHGYGHPRLQRSGASPVPIYIAQLAALAAEAATRGARWPALDLDTRRRLLDAALTKANIRGLPARPTGQHVVSDLMAFYFRSSEANDLCYRAMINREVCRPIAITTKRPAALTASNRGGHGGHGEKIVQDLPSASSVSSVVES